MTDCAFLALTVTGFAIAVVVAAFLLQRSVDMEKIRRPRK